MEVTDAFPHWEGGYRNYCTYLLNNLTVWIPLQPGGINVQSES